MMSPRVALFLLPVLLGCANPAGAGASDDAPVISRAGLIGSWHGTDRKGTSGQLVFFPNGRMIFAIGKLRIGDSSAGSPFEVTFRLNESTTPWEIDVIVRRDDAPAGVLRGLLEVVDRDTIRVGFHFVPPTGFDGPRPTDFSTLDEDEILVLKRVGMHPGQRRAKRPPRLRPPLRRRLEPRP